MWSIETIRSVNEVAARRARFQKKLPVVLESVEEIDNFPPFPFPHLGYDCEKVDKKRERIETLFCDSTGVGSNTWGAFTVEQLKYRLKELVQEHGAIYVAIEEVGQFQLHLAVWK
jgi:hypothetical protein